MIPFRKRTVVRSSRVKKDDNDDDDESNTVVSASATAKDADAISGEVKLSKVTTVYESAKEIIPHHFAGDSATASSQLDPATIKATGMYGPVQAPSFLRATSRFDYQPDICKDYKETGFCGYGDNCKFLHDRGDYKSGWQMEREWEDKQAAKRQRLQLLEERALTTMGVDARSSRTDETEENYEVLDEDEFPFACHLCREGFSDPVVTLCGHFFCRTCAVEGSKRSSRCAVCNKQTYGVFNKARKLIKYMESKGLREKTRLAVPEGEGGLEDSQVSSSLLPPSIDPQLPKPSERSRLTTVRRGKWEEVV